MTGDRSWLTLWTIGARRLTMLLREIGRCCRADRCVSRRSFSCSRRLETRFPGGSDRMPEWVERQPKMPHRSTGGNRVRAIDILADCRMELSISLEGVWSCGSERREERAKDRSCWQGDRSAMIVRRAVVMNTRSRKHGSLSTSMRSAMGSVSHGVERGERAQQVPSAFARRRQRLGDALGAHCAAQRLVAHDPARRAGEA